MKEPSTSKNQSFELQSHNIDLEQVNGKYRVSEADAVHHIRNDGRNIGERDVLEEADGWVVRMFLVDEGRQWK